jgi:mono/diheme cytochrome c family protein
VKKSWNKIGRVRNVVEGPDGYLYLGVEGKGIVKICTAFMRILLVFYLVSLGFLSAKLTPQKTKAESIVAGAEIYQDFCLQCHLASGEGVSGVFPPLKKFRTISLKNINSSIAGIKYGLKGEITVNDEVYDGIMVTQGLDDEEIADVMNYILNQWGNSSDLFINAQQVAAVPKSLIAQ